jgi:N-acetylglutamate synthase-like GNAT family acetyltransferase
MIRHCNDADFSMIHQIINDAAAVYQDVIPEDCWHDPYMSEAQLRRDIGAGVAFSGYTDGGRLVGVMGLQPVQDVTLIRHAYVCPECQHKGVGRALLAHLHAQATTPVLVGAWTAAKWAVGFYERNGFTLVSVEEKVRLLKKYWTITERQIVNSVVLGDDVWLRDVNR